MRVGITGHQRLPHDDDWMWVKDEMNKIIKELPAKVTGVTSLAAGADQLFADLILKNDGMIYVVVPFEGYEESFEELEDRNRYNDMRGLGMKIEVLPRKTSDEESYLAAGQKVVELSNVMIAVWNGKPAAGLGGTADIVDYALQKNVQLYHINPLTRTVTKNF